MTCIYMHKVANNVELSYGRKFRSHSELEKSLDLGSKDFLSSFLRRGDFFVSFVTRGGF